MIQVAMTVALGLALLVAPLTAAPVAAQGVAPAQVVLPTDRTVLPIPEPQYPHSTVFDVRNATPPPRFEVKAPAKAPNVLIVLIDDMGFGEIQLRRHPQRDGHSLANGIKAKGEIRSQLHHVIDIAPTVLEAAGLPEPKSVNGTPQTPIEGVSMVYTFADAAPIPAQDAILRDLRQPGHLSRRLAGPHRASGRLGRSSRGARSRKTSGSCTHADGLQLGQRPGRQEPSQAQGTAGSVSEGSREVPGAAAGRSHGRADERQRWSAGPI